MFYALHSTPFSNATIRRVRARWRLVCTLNLRCKLHGPGLLYLMTTYHMDTQICLYIVANSLSNPYLLSNLG